MSKILDWYRQNENCSILLLKQFSPQRYWVWSEAHKIPFILGKTSFSFELQWHFSQAMHCTGWNDSCSYLKQTSWRMVVLFLMSSLPTDPGFKMSFEQNSVGKNLFLSASFRSGSRVSSREMQQKVNFGGPISYGNWYLEFLFRPIKFFRLHTKLYDAAGAVRAHSGKSLGYWNIIGRGPNSCLLGHVTGLLFCLYVKLILPCVFNFSKFLNKYVLHCTRYWVGTYNCFWGIGSFLDGKNQGYSFRPPKKYKPTKQAFPCTRNLHRFVWNSGCLDFSELPNIPPRDVKSGCFAKKITKC